ncbi:MAG: membrane biogenesis protein [Candidatus Pacearchaeota archaeon]|nr:membrane biogenesis protein [Candidatus Pacearchaeota archaeon]
MGENKFNKIFGNKPIIGMIHLAGEDKKEKIQRALEELSIYEQERVDGAIIEDYHGGMYDVYDTLKEAQKQNYKIILGVNNLRNPYLGLDWADEFGAKFVQFDSVQSNSLSQKYHKIKRKEHPNILILGGVRFKYTNTSENSLEKDLKEGMSRCDAIVTTGEGTGIETPVEKLKTFKNYLKEFPLIVGAGVNAKNAYEQLQIADGAIVGSSFKPNKDTRLPVDKYLIRELMDIVKEVRENGI